jgi:predicted ATPase
VPKDARADGRFIRTIRLDGFLSFAPGSAPFDLLPLNVLIGPNGAGKSNLIEAFEVLKSAPTDLAGAIRKGGPAADWLWKGGVARVPATIEVATAAHAKVNMAVRYRLEFTEAANRLEVLDEAIENSEAAPNHPDVCFYYRFQRGHPVINARSSKRGDGQAKRSLKRDSILLDQSILSQRKDPDLYPEVTNLGQRFAAIQTSREWAFGRDALLRQPQGADLPDDVSLPDARNLALILNQIEHHDSARFNALLHRFLPQFHRMSTRVSGGTVQFYLHEAGLRDPIPATRVSDGTLRFMALLATLLAPSPPPLVCIEEPELGLHPDAMAIVADLLIEASVRTQIILTTHSDALVSALTPHTEAVVAVERTGNSTVLRRLDPDHLSAWLDNYRLGDLWRMGELGANP